jgi:hypothetical protein
MEEMRRDATGTVEAFAGGAAELLGPEVGAYLADKVLEGMAAVPVIDSGVPVHEDIVETSAALGMGEVADSLEEAWETYQMNPESEVVREAVVNAALTSCVMIVAPNADEEDDVIGDEVRRLLDQDPRLERDEVLGRLVDLLITGFVSE